MKQHSKMVRQGDVLLIPIKDQLVTGAPREVEHGRLVLAKGEATGHHHSVPAQNGVALLDEGAVTYLTIDELVGPVPLTHQEHETIIVPPGMYRVVRQREWGDDDEPSQVLD